MVFFNYALRKLNAKIVYYGPGLCGKTTNLQWIHDHFEGGQRGKMISLATEGDRTIFFDLLPIDIGTIRGMDVTLQLYTVPGQVHYNSTRQLVLRGADGVVFVADSQRTMRSSNVESFENLQENLMLQGIDLKDFPHILQFNKRDLRDLLSTEDLNESLNVFSVPIFEAIATEGIGVQESLEGIVKLVMRNLREKYEPVASATGPQAPAPMQVTGPMAFQPEEPAEDAPDPLASDFVSQVEAPPEPEPPVVPATVAPAGFETPQTVAPAVDETQDVGPDSGFAAFQDEDGISTEVYESDNEEIAAFEEALEPEPQAGADSQFSVDEKTPVGVPPTEEPREFDGLFTDPRDEDGTTEHVVDPTPAAPADVPADVPADAQAEDSFETLMPTGEAESAAEAEPVVEAASPASVAEVFAETAFDELPSEALEPLEDVSPDEPEIRDDLTTDPEFMAEEPEAESSDESMDDLFEPDEVPTVKAFVDEVAEIVEAEGAEAGGDEHFPPSVDPSEMLVAPPSNDRFEDRIEAPGPFAPAASETTPDDAVGTTEVVDDPEAVHAEVRQALGASEDREALASLSVDLDQVIGEAPAAWDEPVEAQPVEEQPFESPMPEEPAAEDFGMEPETEPEPEPEPEPAPEPEAPFVEPEVTVEPVVEAVVEVEPEEPPPVEPVTPPPPETIDDPIARSQPIMVGSGDPFASDDSETAVPEVIPQETPIVPASSAIDVTAEDNQLHLQLKGSGAIAEMGQVRALDIEVPVPGQWVGNRKVTLQLRLTLTPAEEENE